MSSIISHVYISNILKEKYKLGDEFLYGAILPDILHTAAGVANAKEIYGLDTTTTGATQLSYQGIKAEFADTEGVTLKNTNTFSQYFQTVTPTISTVKDFDTQQTLLNLKAGITKVRIYMWVEGQDVDCENNASGTDISFNVQITKATE